MRPHRGFRRFDRARESVGVSGSPANLLPEPKE
jgi:hypothetical protein